MWDDKLEPGKESETKQAREKLSLGAKVRAFYADASLSRRIGVAFGGVAFLAGLVLVVYGAIAMLSDSETVAGPRQDVTDRFDRGLPSLGTPLPTPEPDLQVTPPPEPPLEGVQYRIIIERLGVDAPVDTYGLDANAIPEVPLGDDARDVVAWYDFSAQPGTGSNAVFAGHVTWFGSAVFYDLVSMQAGDEITLRGENGAELVYSVFAVFQVDPSDPDAVKVMHGTDEDIVTLITCDGTYVDTGDPVFGGDYSHRLVVQARLQSVNTGAAAALQ